MSNRPYPRTAGLLAALAVAAAASAATAAPVFDPDLQPIGYLAQPRSTSLDVRDGNQFVYYPDYRRRNWTGNLRPFTISPLGILEVAEEQWPGGAAPVLNQLVFGTGWKDDRKVVTLKDDGTRVIFYDNTLSNGQKDLISGSNQKEIIYYIRGQRTNESPNGKEFRVRSYVLGDILRSRPAYVGGTVPMLYVGANDGMLHAFKATTGEEVYAYIPSMLIPKLGHLAPLQTSGYTHKHYVDASPRAIQVQIGGSTKRILVGGLGAGGKGLYSLDITADSSAVPATEQDAANKIMWEITNSKIIVTNPKSATNSASYANLGYTYGEPIIGKSNHVITGTDRDVIFMPNGYMSTNGKATLFVINPANGALIREIDTGTGSAGSPNGLSSPTPYDANGDGRIDYLYAGDLDGNMWKFDVSSTNVASWTMSLLYATSPAQSITTAPSVAAHPQGGRIVAFGTGRVLMAADMTDNAVHYMYGIWDGAPVGATTLLTQTLSAEQVYNSADGKIVRRVRTLSNNPPDWTTHRGWKVALPAGQRVAGDRLTLTNARVYANTFNPTVNLTGASATPPEPVYENWKYQFSFLNGGGFTQPVFDLNADAKFDAADLLADAGGTPMIDRVAMGMFQNAGVASQPVVVTTTVGSQDLYSQNPDRPAPAVPPAESGVSGGHFDADVYYPTGFDTATGRYKSYGKQQHIHEYDDKFGVTGVNMLNASDPNLNLSNASFAVKRTTPETEFKVLVSHQRLNPAAELVVGPSGTRVKVKDYGGQASETDAEAVRNNAPTYTYGTIGYLVFVLPLDAFASKDWWGGTGQPDIRAGLIPTQTGCVNSLSDTPAFGTLGPGGVRHNGALIVQLIRADTPASALELVIAGDASYGWRVKASAYRKHMLAQWTYFWHHPNGKCYGASGWVANPPQDPGDDDPNTPPPGTADPRDGTFSGTSGGTSIVQCSGNLLTNTVSFNKQTLTTTEVATYSGPCTVTTTSVNDGFGNVTVTVTTTPASGAPSSYTYSYKEVYNWTPNHTRTGANTGRVSWRELIRE